MTTKRLQSMAANTPTGFSTLEALAALMVLNLSLLGLFSQQLKVWQAQRETLALNNSVELAQDLWHRMQINIEGLPAYQLSSGESPSSVDCQRKACDPTEWAKADLSDWYNALQLRMPGAQARLATLIHPSPMVQLRLAWPQSPSSTDTITEGVDCPEGYRCWETSWTP